VTSLRQNTTIHCLRRRQRRRDNYLRAGKRWDWIPPRLRRPYCKWRYRDLQKVCRLGTEFRTRRITRVNFNREFLHNHILSKISVYMKVDPLISLSILTLVTRAFESRVIHNIKIFLNSQPLGLGLFKGHFWDYRRYIYKWYQKIQ
jgi:hypothetical protein